MVCNLCIQLRLYIFSAVRNCGICTVQLDVLNTFGDTAERERRLDVGIDLTADFFPFHQCRKTEFLQIIKAKLRCNLDKRLDCDDIHRILNSKPERGKTPVSLPIPVAHRRSVRVGIRRVILCCREGKSRRVEGRRVC